jgi:hypothetical protein
MWVALSLCRVLRPGKGQLSDKLATVLRELDAIAAYEGFTAKHARLYGLVKNVAGDSSTSATTTAKVSSQLHTVTTNAVMWFNVWYSNKLAWKETLTIIQSFHSVSVIQQQHLDGNIIAAVLISV